MVQQTAAQLGELDAAGRAQARALARTITGDREQPDLFTPAEADPAVPVRLRRIRLERGRTFGDVWLGWTLWRALRRRVRAFGRSSPAALQRRADGSPQRMVGGATIVSNPCWVMWTTKRSDPSVSIGESSARHSATSPPR